MSGNVKTKPFSAMSNYWADDSLGAPWSPISINSTIGAMIDDSLLSGPSSAGLHLGTGSASWSDTTRSWQFSEVHLEILSRFQKRTALTIGDHRMAPVYRDVVCQLVFTYPLIHMVDGLTLMHDADVSLPREPALSSRQKHASVRHWDIATKLFNHILANPIPPSYRDAIWATGVHLSAASFWYVESANINDAWPLKPDEPEDLSWMKFGEGKRHLWRVADPTRTYSAFHIIMKQRPCLDPPDWMVNNSTSRILERVKQEFNITSESMSKSNAYHLPVLILSCIQNMCLTHANCLNFPYMIAFVTPKFLILLEVKDAHAVFSLGWWFKMILDGYLWWIARRAKLEGRAARVWFQRENPGLGVFLDSLVREHEEDLVKVCGCVVDPVWEQAQA